MFGWRKRKTRVFFLFVHRSSSHFTGTDSWLPSKAGWRSVSFMVVDSNTWKWPRHLWVEVCPENFRCLSRISMEKNCLQNKFKSPFQGEGIKTEAEVNGKTRTTINQLVIRPIGYNWNSNKLIASSRKSECARPKCPAVFHWAFEEPLLSFHFWSARIKKA